MAGARLFPSFLGGRRRLQRVCSGVQYGGRRDGKREAGHSPGGPFHCPTARYGWLRGGSGDRRRRKPVFGSAEDCVRAGGVLQCGVKGVDQRAQASTHRYADRQIRRRRVSVFSVVPVAGPIPPLFRARRPLLLRHCCHSLYAALRVGKRKNRAEPHRGDGYRRGGRHSLPAGGTGSGAAGNAAAAGSALGDVHNSPAVCHGGAEKDYRLLYHLRGFPKHHRVPRGGRQSLSVCAQSNGGYAHRHFCLSADECVPSAPAAG